MTPDTNPRVRLWPFGWVRHILRDGAPYLDRFTLREQGPSGTNPWRAYLHRFVAGDGPGHCHNHPSSWSFSIVLWGSYTEEVATPHNWDGAKYMRLHRRRVRWFNWVRADKYHRITELHPRRPGGAVWTLFLAGPLARDVTGAPRGWGFWVPGVGHVPAGPRK